MTDQTTIAERVATACHASNLKVEADRGGQADVLIALAWSKSRLGSALMRLTSEFDAIEKPRPLGHDALVRLALTMHSDASTAPLRIKEKQEMARIEATKWYANEKALFLPRLKTLPTVVAHMTICAKKWQIDKPNHVATVCVGYWLDQVCNYCHGLKFETIPDAPALSAKQCKHCHGTGMKTTPYGKAGRMLINYMDECAATASTSIYRRLKANHD
jgi:hypothetical protein